ncbi:MAG: Hpt domain-containing protein [SAR324 cluster bacterium]|nr:Hpt domain-containing protein [SAR324 cluster bacterium]
MKILNLFILCLLIVTPASSLYADIDPREGCDSCLFKINSLEQPYDLTGKWLFSRKDREQNKAVTLDTSDWELINAPGPWMWVELGKTFTVGWYRGVFEFSPEMMGQKVVVFMDTYLSRTQIYLDGNMIFQRPDLDHFQSYYPIQSIPAVFTITKTRHVFTFRVQTYMMTGTYQLPLKIQKFDAGAYRALGSSQLWGGGGQIRLVSAYFCLAFGLFFLLVYFKTRELLYLLASLLAMITFPFFGFPGESFIRSWGPEVTYILHYMGLYVAYFIYLFIQYFTGWRPVLNKYLGISSLVSAVFFPVVAFVYRDVTLMLIVRYVCVTLAFTMVIFAYYDLCRAYWKNRSDRDLRTIFVGLSVLIVTASNDAGIDFGLFSSYGMLSIGFIFLISSLLWVASIHFADTFQENKRLVHDLTNINENLEGIVADRTKALREKTNDIQSILQNMPEGILTVTYGNKIHHEYSAYLEKILETKDIAEKDVMEVVFRNSSLGADSFASVDTVLGACLGEDSMNFLMNQHLMISELEKHFPDGKKKHLELSWASICDDDDMIDKIMLSIRDVTELKKLQKEADSQKRELEMIGQILSIDQEKFFEFIASAENFLDANEKLILETREKNHEILETLFRNMHTIKGNARTYGLLHMTNQVHEAEHEYDELRKHEEKIWNPEQLIEQLQTARKLLLEYKELNEKKLGRKGPGRRGDGGDMLTVPKSKIEEVLSIIHQLDVKAVDRVQHSLHTIENTLKRFGTQKLEILLSGILNSLPSLAKELAKEQPEIVIQDKGILIKKQAFGLIRNAFMHIFRNSLDHGLEKPADRTARGKTPQGTITLTLELQQDRVLFRYKDDGRGLAVSRIRQKALENKLIAPNEVMSAQEVAQLVFRSGFSTAEKVTEVSGRGVGMDAVKKFFQQEGGDVMIQLQQHSEADDFIPCEFLLWLPEGHVLVTEDSQNS